ncbi:putative FAD-binding oxidoreductase [Xylariaceae sp. FL0662B]|nr:putative FAD-binding oxidoreductase [Xylariaceae sp. FL0662B]
MAFVTAIRALVGLLMLCGVRASPDKALCDELDVTLSNSTVMSTDARYETLSTENWSHTARAKPTCIVQPASTKALSYVVSRLVSCGVRFAIRSGGHSVLPGSANINGGVLIDMSKFNSVEYDAENGVVTVGSGLRWAEVYKELDQHGVTVVGGRVPDVGVGGLTLGGGLSYLTDLYGLVCDNVVNFEVVTAAGSIVDANADSNEDLFWALKGGANNFGVVTKFTLKTYPIFNVWGGTKFYTLDSLPALFEAFAKYQTVANKDPYANVMLQAFPTHESIDVLLRMVYLKPEENPKAFDPFYDIKTVKDTTKLQTLTDIVNSEPRFQLTRINWFSTSFKPDAELFNIIGNILTTSPELEEVKSLTGGAVAIGWQPISSSAALAGQERGGNALGLEAANQTWLVIDVGWWSPEDDARVTNTSLSIINKIKAVSKSTGNYVEHIFMNDASADQPVIEHYGPENVAKMREVQRKYDPDRVFQGLVPGGFKLPREEQTSVLGSISGFPAGSWDWLLQTMSNQSNVFRFWE